MASASTSCLRENAWICAEYLQTRQDRIIDATSQHLLITVTSVVIGLVVAIPLALLARRYRPAQGAVLGVATGLYTIPSIALFSLLLPYLGLGVQTVVFGLVLYSLTILVRNVLAGLDAVPSDVVETARGMGYGSTRMLLRVEMPLALPTIMAGLRVATVSTVALTTIGVIVGAGGLGKLLSEGIRTQFKAELLTASLICVLLSLVLDLILLGIQRALTPWTRRAA